MLIGKGIPSRSEDIWKKTTTREVQIHSGDLGDPSSDVHTMHTQALKAKTRAAMLLGRHQRNNCAKTIGICTLDSAVQTCFAEVLASSSKSRNSTWSRPHRRWDRDLTETASSSILPTSIC